MVCTGDGPSGVVEPRRIQRISEAVPQHHLWTASDWRPSWSEFFFCYALTLQCVVFFSVSSSYMCLYQKLLILDDICCGY